uniref:Uncharacterized protein n=1 Tax=Opuntia streptacantha TaxID=393608 RepID=A0A7C9CJH8_OPUST
MSLRSRLSLNPLRIESQDSQVTQEMALHQRNLSLPEKRRDHQPRRVHWNLRLIKRYSQQNYCLLHLHSLQSSTSSCRISHLERHFVYYSCHPSIRCIFYKAAERSEPDRDRF